MSNKHTPGPWEWDDEGAPFAIYTHGDMGGIHAKVLTTADDARLIAAAPDLLAALEALMHTADNDPAYPDVVLLAIDAIRKARGTP